MDQQIDLSLVIANHNTRKLLGDCLQSLQRGNGGISTEAIVVDNGSSDGSPEMLAERFPDAILIRNSTNEGFAKPNNQGLRIARGRYLMLLNSDTIVRPRALETLVRFMDEHPEVGACGPRLLYPDGRLQPSCRSLPSLWRHFCDMTGLETFFPNSAFGNFETRFKYDRDEEVDQPMGAALLVRREAVQDVGYLDERLKIYYNDADWCMRIRQAGWSIRFVHDSEIIHHGSMTTAITNRRLEQFDEMFQNCLYYYQKHFGRAAIVVYKVLTAFGFFFRAIFWKLVFLSQKNNAAFDRLAYARKALRVGLRFWRVSI
ncbi:MAG: glycosyltransferase family 2 protein [Bacteroidota bacterium]